jgi:hypothetical protein
MIHRALDPSPLPIAPVGPSDQKPLPGAICVDAPEESDIQVGGVPSPEEDPITVWGEGEYVDAIASPRPRQRGHRAARYVDVVGVTGSRLLAS